MTLERGKNPPWSPRTVYAAGAVVTPGVSQDEGSWQSTVAQTSGAESLTADRKANPNKWTKVS